MHWFRYGWAKPSGRDATAYERLNKSTSSESERIERGSTETEKAIDVLPWYKEDSRARRCGPLVPWILCVFLTGALAISMMTTTTFPSSVAHGQIRPTDFSKFISHLYLYNT